MTDQTKTRTLKPYQRWRHPPGCPDSDWCSGNGVCYWRCDADPDADLYEDLPTDAPADDR